MSIHIGAKSGEIADIVLLPGDPLRAKWLAENYLEDCHRYSEIRRMYGFTGTYQGRRISVQGSGMGIPSLSIYANELIRDYGAKLLLRIGSFLPGAILGLAMWQYRHERWGQHCAF